MNARLTPGLVAELVLLTLVAAVAAAALPLHAGFFGWSWDALNHHIYLGLLAESNRLNLDVYAANAQTYQYPYLYWPVYRLSLLDAPGAWVGAGWAAAQTALALPPLWFIAWRLFPTDGPPAAGVAWRSAACVLGVTSVVVLNGVETTSNDLLAAVPLLWGLALMAGGPHTNRRAFLAATLWGVSAAFKLSNAIFIPLLLLWWWVPGAPLGHALPWRRGLALSTGAAVGLGLAYGPWAWRMWRLTGNPLFPYATDLLGPFVR